MMSGLRELYPFVRRVDRQLVLAHRKLDQMLSMLEVLAVHLADPAIVPGRQGDKPLARQEICRTESLLRVIETRLRGLVSRRP